MVLSQYRCAIGTFNNRSDVELAIKQLKSAGFPIERISVLAKEADRKQQLNASGLGEGVRIKYIDDSAQCATVTGSMIGAIGGCLIGLGVLALPGVVPIVAVGTSGAAIAATLAGMGIGAASGGLLEALFGTGMTLEQAECSDRFYQNGYLVIVNGRNDEVYQAESILSSSHSIKVEMF